MSGPRKNVMVIGASGTLGNHLARGLLSGDYASHFNVSLLVRGDSTSKPGVVGLKSLGAKVVIGDLALPQQQLSKLLAGIDVVLSAYNSNSGDLLTGQLSLLAASKAAGVTYFVPSDFGAQVEVIGKGSIVPPLDGKIDLRTAVRESGLSYTFIDSGGFSEYILSPFFGVDVANHTVTAPETFDTKITTTTLADIGRLTADILATGRARNQSVLLGGSTLTYEELTQVLEKHTGKAFKRVTKKKADFEAAVAANPYDFAARFAVLVGAGKGLAWETSQTYNHKHNINTTPFEVFAATALKAQK